MSAKEVFTKAAYDFIEKMGPALGDTKLILGDEFLTITAKDFYFSIRTEKVKKMLKSKSQSKVRSFLVDKLCNLMSNG